MRSKVFVLAMTVFFVVASFQPFAMAQSGQPTDEEKILGYFSETDREFIRIVVLPYIQSEIEEIYGQPTVDERRALFADKYRRLVQLLAQQHDVDGSEPSSLDESFNDKSDREKIQISTLRLIMAAIADDVDSVYYGIADDVYDDLFAEQGTALGGFSQLTYKPLLTEISGIMVAVPMAVVATALLFKGSRSIRPQAVRSVLLITGSILALSSLSGCSVWDFLKDNSAIIVDIITQIIVLWQTIEGAHKNFQANLIPMVYNLFLNIVKLIDQPDKEYKETIKRQLYASVFVTVVDFLVYYITDPEYQDQENALFRLKHGLPPDYGDPGADLNRVISGDIDIDDVLDSIQLKVIWERFLDNVKEYVTYEDDDFNLADELTKAAEELKTAVLKVIFEALDLYTKVYEKVNNIIAKIKGVKDEAGVDFDPESQEDRLDMQAMAVYIGGFHKWIDAAGKAEAGDPPGQIDPTLDYNNWQFRIVTDNERRLGELRRDNEDEE